MPDEESLSDGTIVGSDVNAEESQDGGPTTNRKSSPQGYERLAETMADYPSTAIFRQFGFLNTLNLLYYQAELTQLEIDLFKAANLDKDSVDPCRQLYFQHFQLLRNGVIRNNEQATDPKAQWEIILKLRSVTKEYNEAIIAQRTIRNIPRPNKELIQDLRSWITDNGNNEHVLLRSKDYDVWWKIHLCDLVALHAREYEDAISTWITQKALGWYHKVLGRHSKKRVLTGTSMASTSIYSTRPLLRFVTILAIGIASLMPILSIVLLNAIHSNNARLGILALFTVIFCALFGIFAGPKKTELFAASAAFAAVQVVFINGNNGSQQS